MMEPEEHICSGRSCMYCRVLETPQRNRPGKETDSTDGQVVTRIRDLENGSLLTKTESPLAISKLNNVEKLPSSDNLTELHNSRTFVKRLRNEVKRASRYKRPVAVCLVSIDRFRDIEKQYGALASDAILKIAAQIMQTTIREVDIAARYNAYQFALILPETNKVGASFVAERIRQRIAVQAISHEWQNLRITVSIGLSSYPANAKEENELITKAMSALEQATQEGGNAVCTA